MAAKRPTNWWLWAKMLAGGAAVCVGGPAMVMWLSPTDEELFQKYNPELKKKSLERRYERQKEFDDFVIKLKEQSKSDKPIWLVQKEEAERAKQESVAESLRLAQEVKAKKEAMRREAGLPADKAD